MVKKSKSNITACHTACLFAVSLFPPSPRSHSLASAIYPFLLFFFPIFLFFLLLAPVSFLSSLPGALCGPAVDLKPRGVGQVGPDRPQLRPAEPLSSGLSQHPSLPSDPQRGTGCMEGHRSLAYHIGHSISLSWTRFECPMLYFFTIIFLSCRLLYAWCPPSLSFSTAARSNVFRPQIVSTYQRPSSPSIFSAAASPQDKTTFTALSQPDPPLPKPQLPNSEPGSQSW